MTRNELAKIIWETSRADESTISATGANIVAEAIITSRPLYRALMQARREAWEEGVLHARFHPWAKPEDNPYRDTPGKEGEDVES